MTISDPVIEFDLQPILAGTLLIELSGSRQPKNEELAKSSTGRLVPNASSGCDVGTHSLRHELVGRLTDISGAAEIAQPARSKFSERFALYSMGLGFDQILINFNDFDVIELPSANRNGRK